MSERCELRLPDLGLTRGPATISLWLVTAGSTVFEGDRLVEILADSVTVDLPAPATGKLIELLAGEDEVVVPGQLLAVIEGLH